MSLVELQRATATLIRFPEVGRANELKGFLAAYALSAVEQRQLRSLAENRQVSRYGQKLRRFRFSDATDNLGVLRTILGDDQVERLWFECFEPKAGGIGAEELTDGFLQFLKTSRVAQRVVKESGAPEFFRDLVRYLAAESSLAIHGDEWLAQKPPAGSLLRHGGFAVLRLDHDVPRFLQMLGDKGGTGKRRAPRAPSRRRVYSLLLIKEEGALPAVFEIDAGTFAFLRRQLRGEKANGQRPAVYQGLVEAGLCLGPASARLSVDPRLS